MGIKILKLNRPIFLASEQAVASFVYKMKDEAYRTSVMGCDILLDGYIKTNDALDKDFLLLVHGSDKLEINFIIVSNAPPVEAPGKVQKVIEAKFKEVKPNEV